MLIWSGVYCTSYDLHAAYSLCILTLYTHTAYSLCILTLYTHFVYSLYVLTLTVYTLHVYSVYLLCILTLYTCTVYSLGLNFHPTWLLCILTLYTHSVYSHIHYHLRHVACHCYHAGHSPVYIIAVVSTRLQTHVHTVYCVYVVTVVVSVWVSFLSALQYGPSHMDWITSCNCWK